MATGIVLLLIGVWLLSRTFVRDDDGRNLVDRILSI